MDAAVVIDALIRGRQTKRGFLDQAVPLDTVREILSVAKYAPSSSNTQPWRCYSVVGKARDRIADAAVEAYRADPENLVPEYPFFPKRLHEPYAERFNA